MLESCGMALCGVIEYNNSWQEIYADDIGTLVFEPGDGCWIISEVNVESPLELDSVSGLIENIEDGVYGKAIGVVYTATGDIIVFLDEERAVKRSMADMKANIGDPFYYSSDVEYDLDDLTSDEV